MKRKKLVILANSRKHGENCIAGREFDGTTWGGWVRPISTRDGHGLSALDRKFQDGTEPSLMDVIDVPLIHAAPTHNQTENWINDETADWEFVGKMTWKGLQSLAETPPTLWLDGRSTQKGKNDEMDSQQALQLPSSLCMVHVTDAVLFATKFDANSKLERRMRFTYMGITYKLKVTDLLIEASHNDVGEFPIGECLLTISISEPYQKNDKESCCYKLVAGVIRR